MPPGGRRVGRVGGVVLNLVNAVSKRPLFGSISFSLTTSGAFSSSCGSGVNPCCFRHSATDTLGIVGSAGLVFFFFLAQGAPGNS